MEKTFFLFFLVINLVIGSEITDIDDSAMENPDLIEGDIVPEDGYDRNALVSERELWPKGRIPYVINFELRDKTDLIEEAMEFLNDNTCIQFVPRTIEKDYIRIEKGSGCNSELGRGDGGERGLSLGDGCYSLGTVLHELIHSIGFNHEQTRSDRDDYITIHWENIKEGSEHNFEKLKPMENKLLLEYDYNSIMHYGSLSFSKDKRRGLKTMTAKKKGFRLLPPREKMPTDSDIKKINLLYKCSF
ncbi:astacin-like metalloprotease toxin 5 isoform X2 [Stegodyphus dumicola]|uniref:astacin-like metalloprotease toxin 5 isoform X2 n=1 Tax=Stegodyphus dumicola TaxID=202533 RepID=UPI0015AAEEB5|nr:astacin-like metalloprotease toxin 5 isoform X2 [Stegodyphus dumicola]